jgi:hypothetical protein
MIAFSVFKHTFRDFCGVLHYAENHRLWFKPFISETDPSLIRPEKAAGMLVKKLPATIPL